MENTSKSSGEPQDLPDDDDLSVAIDSVLMSVALFEQNDETTRRALRTELGRLLQETKGITYYAIECSDKNNPPEVVDENKIIVDFDILRAGINYQFTASLGGVSDVLV